MIEFDTWFKQSGYSSDYRAVTMIAWQAGIAACWQAVSAKIKQGDLGGTGNDANAERNGLVHAANIIRNMQTGGDEE